MTYLRDGPAGAGCDRTTAADARHQTAVGSGFKDQCIYIYIYVYIEYTVWILDIGAIQINICIYVSYSICYMYIYINQCIFLFWHRVWLKHLLAKGNCAFQHGPMILCCDTFHSWPNKMKGKSGLLGPRIHDLWVVVVLALFVGDEKIRNALKTFESTDTMRYVHSQRLCDMKVV